MKRAGLCLLLASLMLALFVSAAGAASPRLTLMIYMAGSDLESNAGAASEELAEMMAACSGADGVSVLVMASGAKAWRSGEIAADETSIYALGADGLEKVQPGPLRSMGDPDTLLSLLEYGYAAYPAERYALILWDHGGGPMMGVCFDELFTDGQGMDGLTLPELRAALAASPFAREKLSWIGFDACLMASIETASAVAPYAEYMIASQDTEPASGWDYAFLRDIAGDASAEETGRRVIDGYFDSVGSTMATITLSMVDLSVIPAVEEEMNALFGALSGTVDAESYARLTACRTDTRGLGCASPVSYDLVDLTDLLTVCQDAGVADCERLLELLGQAIVHHRENAEYIGGLSVYYPYYNKEEYLARWGKRAAETDFSPGYRSFLRDVSAIWLGDALADWHTGVYMESADGAGGTALSMQLTAGQAAHFGEARLYVLEQVWPGEYLFLYMSDDVTLTREARLETVYTGRALFMADENGEALTDAITYVMRDGVLFVPVILYSELVSGDLDMMSAYLVYREGADGQYALSEIKEITDDPALQGRSSVRLEDWHELQFVGFGFQPAYDEAGGLLPYSRWSVGSSISFTTLRVGEASWRPVFREQYGNRQRVAVLEVCDDQNNVALVEMLPLENPNISSIAVSEQVLVDNEVCRVTLTGAELVSGTDPGVHLFLRCENRTEGKLGLSFRQLAAGRTVIGMIFPDRYADVGVAMLQLDIPGELLQSACVERAQTFSMLLSAYDAVSYSADALFAERVTMEAPMDFAAAFPIPRPGEVFARAAWNGLETELLDLRLDADDASVNGRLHLVNATGEDWVVRADSAYVNSVQHVLTMDAVTLPPGHEAYADFQIATRRRHRGLIWPENVDSMLECLGIEAITDLSLSLSRGRVTFRLREALPYPAGKAADWPVVYDRDGVTVRVIGSFTYPEEEARKNKRYLYLLVSNDTDGEVSLQGMPEPSVIDGLETTKTYIRDGAVPARATGCVTWMYTPWDVETVSPTFGTLETSIGLCDQAGRADLLRLRLDALGEPDWVTYTYPLETTKACIYAPERLRVTAGVEAQAAAQPALP